MGYVGAAGGSYTGKVQLAIGSAWRVHVEAANSYSVMADELVN